MRVPIPYLRHQILAGLILALAPIVMLQGSAGADEAGSSSTRTDKDGSTASPAARRDPSTYKQLIDELEAERRHVDELERKVKALESSNSALQQTTTNLSTGEQQLVTQSGQFQRQMTDVQKTVYSQLGPSVSAIA